MCVLILEHVELMKAAMFVAGDEWEKREQTKEANARAEKVEDGEPSDAWEPLRNYRLAVAYDSKAEKLFLEKNAKLMADGTVWNALPPRCRTAGNRARIHCALSRSSCLVHKVKDRNTNYPNKLVATVTHPELTKEVEADAACPKRMDDGSRAYVDFYDGKLESTDAKMDLVPIAILAVMSNFKLSTGTKGAAGSRSAGLCSGESWMSLA